MKKVAIYGHGYVGQAVEALIKDHYEYAIYDPKITTEKCRRLLECELAIICVPTPVREDGSCDTSIVEETVRSIPQKHILIKSTVAPGTTIRLAMQTGKHIAFSPEFISESTYHNPYYPTMADTPFIIIGGESEARSMWTDFFLPIYGPMTRYYQCTSSEAELIKYMANTYSALKVTFVNEFYEIAKRFGADWHTVREGWLLDERVEPMSTAVFADQRGYSGKCLPKDTLGIIKAAEKRGYTPELLRQVHQSNLKFAGRRLADHLPEAIVCQEPANTMTEQIRHYLDHKVMETQA